MLQRTLVTSKDITLLSGKNRTNCSEANLMIAQNLNNKSEVAQFLVGRQASYKSTQRPQ
eukprot:IDg4793t1